MNSIVTIKNVRWLHFSLATLYLEKAGHWLQSIHVSLMKWTINRLECSCDTKLLTPVGETGEGG